MSNTDDVDVLRRAAASMLEHHGLEHKRFRMWVAIADLLLEEAEYVETNPRHKHTLSSTVYALAVANAYLEAVDDE